MTDIIERLTKKCEREDCSIKMTSSSVSLFGWTQTYDEQGQPQGIPPYTTTSMYQCDTCNKQWHVTTVDSESGNKETVEEIK